VTDPRRPEERHRVWAVITPFVAIVLFVLLGFFLPKAGPFAAAISAGGFVLCAMVIWVSPVTSKGTTLGRNRSLLGFKIPHLGYSV
jgi:hypothetical protein